MDRKSFILLVLFTVLMFFFNNWFFETNKSKTPSQVTRPIELEASAKPVSQKNENFYVLENQYMQVVFSDIGGAVVEINLPFKTEENKDSILLPIETDQIILKNSEANALFPLKSYQTYNSKTLLSPKKGGYYPLLRRGLAGTSFVDISPSYYAFNVVSNDSKEFASTRYKVKQITESSITFEGSAEGKTITKTFRLAKQSLAAIPYSLYLDVQVSGDARGLFLTSGVPEAELISGSATTDIKYRMFKKNKPIISKGKLPKNSSVTSANQIEWLSNSNGFFGIIMNENTQGFSSYETTCIPGLKDPTRLSLINSSHDQFPAKKYPGYYVQIPLNQETKTNSFTLYAGPYDQNLLTNVDRILAKNHDGISPDFAGALTMHGWFSFISEPFAKFLFVIMQFSYKITHSWVVAIFLLTVVLRIILFPLNNWQIKSMAKLQDLSPQIENLKKKNANDPKKMNMEILELYKQKGVSPFSSILPLFIQLPFFIGMLDLLKSAFQLRGAIFIPGWINNLTAPDTLFSWGYPLPLIGDSFHLLPLILGGLTFLQQKITLWVSDNKVTTKEASKEVNQRNLIITAVFTFLFYNFPSGLNLYWIFSTLLGLVQQLALANKLPFLPKLKTR